jgi:hypothetical protein
MPVIFVAGVHGVGKSTLCAAVSLVTSVPSFTASELIRAKQSTLIQTGTKDVIDVANNQSILIDAVQEKTSDFEHIVVDGHVTLFSNNTIVNISSSVFYSINVKLIILILESPNTIYSRLEKRDGNAYPVDLLRTHQTFELKHAREIASNLCIPFIAVHSDASEVIANLIVNLKNNETWRIKNG